ncbi:MAG: hypothetical protein LBS12_00855 [Prevotellaceae bacterium]|jgi:hypothetical protein|nr:hypothetical protein [Prevotellaceae bacterium]
MKPKHFLLPALLCCMACAPRDEVQITVSTEIISEGYIGNGVEWDPYDEAEAWGAAISDNDWRQLFARLDFMRPGYVRCMINSPYRYYDAATGNYDKTRNIASIARLLQYCTDRNITVMYGEYNPPSWSMKADQRWIDMSVDYLNYLVNDLGFSCIKYFVIFNEPDGNWASTNGDYLLWKSILHRFADKMRQYPTLSEKVKFAGPDVVMEYKNAASMYDAVGWVQQTVADADSFIGLYDVHAYPGQAEVRSGTYAERLAAYKQPLPEGKKIVLGEAGYKYWRTADSLLMREYRRRAAEHPLTRGSDANMFVYDYFYGLDMALLCMEVMNSGYSGMAAWMLDDAMHSNGDAGKPEDIKLWGMWNILGSEVFNDPAQENIRPWFYTWSLMCRWFPAGATILEAGIDRTQGIFAAVAEYRGQYTAAFVNIGHHDRNIKLLLPSKMERASLYVYEEGCRPVDADGHPVPVKSEMEINKRFQTALKAQSFQLITNME